ncbi:hypothetical protein NQ315_017517 [Exocentrus adspersus]|uniref:Uncharacterized protein n=1 Tax=Exocentrus adspersus TaxID=1586481 RepID=A0AAV8VKD7_9CUCU|nr:hypothetical protein NQ315_017517 [Exocentrus adspersus]
MASEMEKKRKSRKVLRSSFTRAANDLEVLLNDELPDVDSTKVSWEILLTKRNELEALDSIVYDIMLENATEVELESEIEARDGYLKRFTTLKIKYDKLFVDATSTTSSQSSTNTSHHPRIVKATGKRKFKLPTLEFKQYDGSVKGLNSKTIHEDKTIDDHDKIEYWIQAMSVGSRARQLVKSYPMMGENYQKIIESMQRGPSN